MWLDEVQRIGKRRCTPTGYQLQVISDLIGFSALILLFVIPVFLIVKGTFNWMSLLFIVLPFAVAFLGDLLYSYSWHLADMKSFKYDYEKRESTWLNDDGSIESINYENYRKFKSN